MVHLYWLPSMALTRVNFVAYLGINKRWTEMSQNRLFLRAISIACRLRGRRTDWRDVKHDK